LCCWGCAGRGDIAGGNGPFGIVVGVWRVVGVGSVRVVVAPWRVVVEGKCGDPDERDGFGGLAVVVVVRL
jgi:hypothetical protein